MFNYTTLLLAFMFILATVSSGMSGYLERTGHPWLAAICAIEALTMGFLFILSVLVLIEPEQKPRVLEEDVVVDPS